ncbi:MAG: PAS domain-containing sensor histidine kinase [Peptostreptococcaceae bacterium]
MLVKGEYIKILSNSPIPCMWVSFGEKEDCIGNYINILGVNKKLKELSSKEIRISDKYIFHKNKYNKLRNIIEENNQDENISIVDFVEFLDGFYQMDISKVTDDLFVIWYTKKIEINENIEILLDNMGAFTWCKDTMGRYIYTSIKSDVYPNISPGSVVGKTDYELFPEEVANAFRESDKELLEGNEESIKCLTFFNGKFYNGLNHVIKNENGDILGTIGLCKEALKNNKEQDNINDSKILQLISDTIPDSIFFKDNKGVFRHCNKVFAQYRNLDKGDIIGKKEKDINTPEEKIKKYELEEKKIRETKELSRTTNTFICTDGTTKYFETIKVPFLDGHGMVGGVLGIARDITDRREAELEFERLRMEFFANLSHEFKTPLNLIFSSIQLIEFMIDRGEDSCNYRNYTNIIKQNGYRILKMVNNLIDSTRLSSGCLEYLPQNYNIVEFIENICDSVQYYANQENIKLLFDTNLEEKVIAFDLEKMERIILNLLSNAIKYNTEKGQIEVVLTFENEHLYITVKDSGIGIPKDKLDDVFKLFKQVNNRITKLSEGSGIGLSIVKSLVDLHNGNISVESKENVGSEFTIRLPITLCTEDVQRKRSIKYNRYVETIDIEFSDIYSSIKA